uniref:Uncharacterized protein n=1 Tax=Arundo donax TaxID=35708 RepID=A0A0A9CGW2_ARUDO
MVSMGFLEPSTGRDDQSELRNSIQRELLGCSHEATPPRSSHVPPTSSQFKKACGKHARTSFLSPSGDGHIQTPQFSPPQQPEEKLRALG